MIKNISRKIDNRLSDIMVDMITENTIDLLCERIEIRESSMKYNVLMEWLYKINNERLDKFCRINHTQKTKLPESKGVYNVKLDKYTMMIMHVYEKYVNITPVDPRRSPKIDQEFVCTLYIYGKNKTLYREAFEKQVERVRNGNMSNPVRFAGSSKRVASKPFDAIIGYDFTELLQYLDSWKQSEKIYKKLQIVYKAGVLLYGPPGTGKTTVVKAIAYRYGLRIKTIDCGAPYKELEAALNGLNNCLYLFEDIDRALGKKNDKVSSEEKDAKEGLLLQALDGTNSKDGCIYVATTNHIEQLDEAIIRDGRFDIKIHMGNICREDAEKMCKINNVPPSVLGEPKDEYNPAWVQNMITKYTLKRVYRHINTNKIEQTIE